MPAAEDKFARVIALLSLVASMAAVVVPYVQQRASQEEQFKAELELRGKGSYKLAGINLGEHGKVVQSPWRVTLSNVGNQKLSITRYTLSEGKTPGARTYTGLDGGLTDEQGVAVQLPLVLEGGETRAFILHIGSLVSPKSVDLLQTYASDGSIPVEQGNLVLARTGVDLYGNALTLKEFDSGYMVEWTLPKKPTYWIEVTTGRANSFRASSSP